MKVSELEGAELDYWVAKAQEWPAWSVDKKIPLNLNRKNSIIYSPSNNWDECGPLIEKYELWINYREDNNNDKIWYAHADFKIRAPGNIPQEAICRAVVASVYGEEIPDET